MSRPHGEKLRNDFSSRANRALRIKDTKRCVEFKKIDYSEFQIVDSDDLHASVSQSRKRCAISK